MTPIPKLVDLVQDGSSKKNEQMKISGDFKCQLLRKPVRGASEDVPNRTLEIKGVV